MSDSLATRKVADIPFRGELRYGLELARLTTDRGFLRPARATNAAPVMLIPGFLAGDQSLAMLRGWLRRRGSRTASAGVWLNVDCAERALKGMERRLQNLAHETRQRVVLIGQSRGGELARVLAVRRPDLVTTLIMLGSPVLDPLDVGSSVMRAVRSVARLGDLGAPRMFSTQCAEGECCAAFRDDLRAPMPDAVDAVAIYSRTDGVVSWQACLDPSARHIEVESSHSGMSVNRAVYRTLAEVLLQTEAAAPPINRPPSLSTARSTPPETRDRAK